MGWHQEGAGWSQWDPPPCELALPRVIVMEGTEAASTHVSRSICVDPLSDSNASQAQPGWKVGTKVTGLVPPCTYPVHAGDADGLHGNLYLQCLRMLMEKEAAQTQCWLLGSFMSPCGAGSPSMASVVSSHTVACGRGQGGKSLLERVFFRNKSYVRSNETKKLKGRLQGLQPCRVCCRGGHGTPVDQVCWPAALKTS